MVRIGNFIADHIKGSKYKSYPDDIQMGILLHRQIDSFTDAHEIARKSKRRLHEQYGLYKGIIIDIFYDHMLAKNWSMYSRSELSDYTKDFYAQLKDHDAFLPEKIKYMSQYMIPQDWLRSYAQKKGIQKVLEGMNRRAGGESKMDLAMLDLEENYDAFETDFNLFFAELRDFCDLKLAEIENLFNRT